MYQIMHVLPLLPIPRTGSCHVTDHAMLLVTAYTNCVGNIADTNSIRQYGCSGSSLVKAKAAGFHTHRLPVYQGIAAVVCVTFLSIDSSLLRAGPQWLCSWKVNVPSTQTHAWHARAGQGKQR